MQNQHLKFLTHRVKAALLDAFLIASIPGIWILSIGLWALIPFITGQAGGTPDPRIEFPIFLLILLPILILDGMFVAIGPSLILGAYLGLGGFGAGIFLQLGIMSTLVNWLYHAGFECSPLAATIGKRKFHLSIATSTGQKISFLQASIRHFAKIISLGALFLGFIRAGWSHDGRALHDVLSGSRVVDGENADWQEEPARYIRKSDWLLTLTGLFIVLTPMGIAISYLWGSWTENKYWIDADEAVRQGNYDKAEKLLLNYVEVSKKRYGATGANVAFPLDYLARFYKDRHRYSEAEEIYKQEIPIYEKLDPGKGLRLSLGTTIESLGDCYYRQGRFREAEPFYKRALAMQKGQPPDDQGLNQNLQRLAYIKMKEHNYGEAETLFKRAMAGWSRWGEGRSIIQTDRDECSRGYAELKQCQKSQSSWQ